MSVQACDPCQFEDANEALSRRPEYQGDLARLRDLVAREMKDHAVLELACGSGYWTEVIAPMARSVLGVDAAEGPLAVARRKEYPFGRVRFGLADVQALDAVPGDFTAGMACFWWSRLPKARIPVFLAEWHRRLGSGAKVLLLDHCGIAGSEPLPVQVGSRESVGAQGGCHGSVRRELESVVGGEEMAFTEFEHFWCLTYRVPCAIVSAPAMGAARPFQSSHGRADRH